MMPLPPQDLSEMRSLIAARRIRMSPKVEKVLRFALEHPADMSFSTIQGLAGQCQVSNATVTRLSAGFGFASFHDFRELFRKEVRRVETRWR